MTTIIVVDSKVSVKINAYTFELTRTEALQLLEALKRELGDVSKSNYPWFQLGGPNIAGSARDLMPGPSYPKYTPDHLPPGTITC